jgi:hypothetical protein
MPFPAPRILLAVAALALAVPAAARAEGPDHFAISISPRPVKAGQPVTVKAVAKDAAGATLTGFSGPATFSDAKGELAQPAFASGVASALVKFSEPIRGDAIKVAGGGIASSGAPFNVLGPVQSLDVLVPARSEAGAPFTATIYARDAAGSVVPDYAGTLSWSDTARALDATQPAAFVNGVSTTTVPSTAPVAGDVLAVRSGGLGAESRRFSRVGPLDHLEVSVASSVAAFEDFTVVARARDAVGNLVTSFTGPATWSDVSETLAPAAPSDFVAGVSTTAARLGAAHSDDVITLTAGGLTARSRTFDAYGDASNVVITGVPAGPRVAVPFTLAARVVDEVGNTITGYDGSGTWGYGHQSGSVAFAHGAGRITVTVTQPERRLPFQVSLPSGVSRATSPFATVGPLDHLDAHWSPFATADGCTGTLLVRALDSAGNTVPDYAGAAPYVTNQGYTPAIESGPAAPFVRGVSVTVLSPLNPFDIDRFAVTAGGQSWSFYDC